MKKNWLLLGGHFDFDEKSKMIKELEILMEEPDFWSDVKKANEVNNKISALKKEIILLKSLEERLNSFKEMLSLFEGEEDDNFAKELESDLDSFAKELKEAEISTLFSGRYDDLNCYLEIHPGAGGTESCDWAFMLKNMYQNFCNKKEYSKQAVSYRNFSSSPLMWKRF